MLHTKKLPIIIVGLLISLTLVLVNCATAAPVQYSENGHWYEVVQGSIAWEDAKTAAQTSSYSGMNGHLATITSQEENNFVAGLGGVYGCWLGGFQPTGSSEPNGGWQWVTGESWSYTNWNGGEPNNWGGNENVLHFWYSNMWNDYPSGATTGGYIVEYEPTTSVPEFPSIVLPVAAVIGLIFVFGRRKI